MSPGDAQALEGRVTRLEEKSAFSEDLLEQLNEVIVRQQGQIDLLVREVTRLKQQAASSEAPGVRSLRDELPPHY
ncbi:MAG: SlyX family protein [Rubrivivax sp.]